MSKQYNWFPAMSANGQFGVSPDVISGNKQIFQQGQAPEAELPTAMASDLEAAAPKTDGPSVELPRSFPAAGRSQMVQPPGMAQDSTQQERPSAPEYTMPRLLDGQRVPEKQVWFRLLAAVVDSLCLLPFTLVAAVVVPMLVMSSPDWGFAVMLACYPVLLLGAFFAEIFMLARFQGSPGKLMLGLRVVSEEGPYLSIRTAFMRTIAKYGVALVAGVIPLGSIALLIWCYFQYRSGKRVLWDSMLKTQVVAKSA